MSFEYKIDESGNIVFIHFSSILDDNLLLAAFKEIYAAKAYSPAMNQCVDYSDVTELSITRLGVEKLAALCEDFDYLNMEWVTCIVAPDDLVFGYGRMYQIMCDGSNEQIHVVRSIKAAMKILNLPIERYPFHGLVIGELADY